MLLQGLPKAVTSAAQLGLQFLVTTLCVTLVTLMSGVYTFV